MCGRLLRWMLRPLTHIANLEMVQNRDLRDDQHAASHAAGKLLDDCFWKSFPKRTQQFARLSLGWDFAKNRLLQHTKEQAPVSSEVVRALSKYCVEPRGVLANVTVAFQRAQDGYFVASFDDCGKTAAGEPTRQCYVFSARSPRQCFCRLDSAMPLAVDQWQT